MFLLHWYAARRVNAPEDDCAFLQNFSYETRYSARDFCARLVGSYVPSFTMPISEEIIDQAWFPLDWQKDPTIHSMLVMLDAIDATFGECARSLGEAERGGNSFYFLPIRDMGLTDELSH